MSAYVTGAAISATSAALGYGANALREHGARRDAARTAHSAALQQAMREYMAALDASMMEVEDFPIPPKMTALDRWVERKLQGTLADLARHIFVRLLTRLVYGRRHDDLSDRLVAASARLRLVASPKVEALMREVESLARECPVGDPRLMERWKPLRERIQQEFKSTLDDHHARKLGAVLGLSLVAHKSKQPVGDTQKGNGPGDPRADMQRDTEHRERSTKGQIGHPQEPFQGEVQVLHAQNLRRAPAADGSSCIAALGENGPGAKPIKQWWVPLVLLATWSIVGGLSMIRDPSRLDVGLGLMAGGVIMGALALLPELKSIAPFLPVASGAFGGLGAILSATKVSETHGLWTDAETMAILGVVVTALVMLIWVASKSVARTVARCRRANHPSASSAI